VVDQDLVHVEEAVEVDVLLRQADQAAGLPGVVVVAEDLDLAGGGSHEVRDRADQGRLAGAVGAEQSEERAVGDLEVQTFDGGEPAGVRLREAPYGERGGRAVGA
jgi:hypothetical protein